MRLNRNTLLTVVFLSLLLTLSNTSADPGQSFVQTDLPKIKKIQKQILDKKTGLMDIIRRNKIDNRLNSIIYEKKKEAKPDVIDLRRKLKKDTGNIKIFINASRDVNTFSDELKARGARVIRMKNKMAALEVPVENIERIFSEVDSIENARLPRRFFPLAVESEGVALTGSDSFHNLDFYGAGVRIAVIDVGFKGLKDAQQNGDLPYSAFTHDFSGNGLETEYYHGTACAEIIYDMAPQAEIHLLKISTNADIFDALDYCVDNNIDIISFSLGTFGTGPGDGTGFMDDAFDDIRARGILVVAGVGNQGIITSIDGMSLGRHWKGPFRDPDGDNIHDFIAGDTDVYFNLFAAFPDTNDDGQPETGEVSVLLRWNDWPYANINYDMMLMEIVDIETEEMVQAGSSTYVQDGSQEPVEYISLDIPDNEDYEHIYAVVILKPEGEPAGTEMELYLGGTSYFLPYDSETGPIATSSSSITEPGDAESVFSVGAIDFINWETGPQESYSSQGPTNDWAGSIARIKPDIMGPDTVTTFTYGEESFRGVSAATPHVAGMAALTLSKYPGMTPDELQGFIETNAVDMGLAGKDNIYGWGRLRANTDLSADNSGGGEGTVGSGATGEGGGGGGCFIATTAAGFLMDSHAALYIIAIVIVLIVIVTCIGLRKLASHIGSMQ